MTSPSSPPTGAEETGEPGVEVTCRDLRTGKTEIQVIWDDCLVITAGSAYLASAQAYANGTVNYTIKGGKRR